MSSVLSEFFKLHLPLKKNSALIWDKVKIGNIMRACIILHNIIVENERDTLMSLNSYNRNQLEVHM